MKIRFNNTHTHNKFNESENKNMKNTYETTNKRAIFSEYTDNRTFTMLLNELAHAHKHNAYYELFYQSGHIQIDLTMFVQSFESDETIVILVNQDMLTDYFDEYLKLSERAKRHYKFKSLLDYIEYRLIFTNR